MNLDNWCDEFLHKVLAYELGPVVVDEVDDKSLDVGAVLILICHDHQVTIPQCLQLCHVLVLFGILQSEDLHKIFDLFVVHDLDSNNTNPNILKPIDLKETMLHS